MLQSTGSEPPLTVVTTPLDVAVAAVKMGVLRLDIY
jgi:hypothetical protein